METVEFSEWEKLDLRVALVKQVEEIDGADKLYKLTLDVGELGERIVCAGLKEFYSIEELENRKVIYFANLKPRKLKGIESQGMVLAASDEEHETVKLLEVNEALEPGNKVS